ncbi:hypothetical protein EXIGLDRAFT_842036 [Exidia glandulosa HHB12029]|uniref:F-box domain-containing protein n=1 Tax=Exidia glandulosa HHB12029 TaxID=1314781 RepID=A0A165DIX2_EXIGL|nr:hypothetical protein EXIGLDRAFT_842036 [Exidia glandulosa HHB12029]
MDSTNEPAPHPANRASAAQSPTNVASLPVELLVAVLSHETKPDALMNVAQVCSHWHRVVLNEPSLWAYVRVTPDATPAQLSVQLARSGAHALFIEVKFYTSESLGELDLCLSAIVHEHERVEALVITSDSPPRANVTTPWPAGLVALLGQGRVWPRLRTLRLDGQMWSLIDSPLDLVSPVLHDIDLHMVGVRDWHRFGLGTLLSRVSITAVDAHGVFEMLRFCANLESLLICDYIDYEHYATLQYNSSLALPTFHMLTRLRVDWQTIDPPTLLNLLSRCPNVEDVSISHRGGSQPQEPLRSRYTLSKIRAMTLESQVQASNLLHFIAPFIDFSTLCDLQLRNIRFISPTPAFGLALRTIKLARVDCRTGDLVRAILQCRKLESLTFEYVTITVNDQDRLGDMTPLPLLQNVDVTCFAYNLPLADTTDSPGVLLAQNQQLVDFVMAVLPLHMVREASIHGILLNEKHILRAFSSMAQEDTLYAAMFGTVDRGVTRFTAGAVVPSRAFATAVWDFDVASGTFPDTLKLLHAKARFFSSLRSLRVHMPLLIDTVSVMSTLSVDLPELDTFIVILSDFEVYYDIKSENAHDKLTQLLDQAAYACKARSIVCPHLRTLDFMGSDLYHHVPYPTRTRFEAIFQTQEEVVFTIAKPRADQHQAAPRGMSSKGETILPYSLSHWT